MKSAFPAAGSPLLYGAGSEATSVLTCAGVSGGGGGAAFSDEPDEPFCPQPARRRPVAIKVRTGPRIPWGSVRLNLAREPYWARAAKASRPKWAGRGRP